MLGILALTAAAAFTGAAIYVLVVEQVARLKIEDDRALLAEWQPSYHRGAIMQAGLAMIAALLGAAAWWTTRDPLWAVGAAAMILPWPYTFIIFGPVNKRLTGLNLDEAGAESRALIKQWGRLHVGRCLLGLAGLLAYLAASSAAP